MKINYDKLIWKKATDFIEKKSFYIMVVLCIGIVVFSGLFVTSKNIISSIGYESNIMENSEGNDYAIGIGQNDSTFDSVEQTKQIEGVNSKIAENSQSLEESQNSQAWQNSQTFADSQVSSNTQDSQNTKKTEGNIKSRDANRNRAKITTNQPEDVKNFIGEKNKEVKKGKAASQTQMVTVSKSINEEKTVFELPVIGTIINGFSGEKLIYSKTLNEWRNHDGIDISAVPGTQIKAAADGIIKEVKNDPRFGFTVIIEHTSTLKTVYAAMAESQMVSPNQKVKVGDAIGSLGNTATFESLEPAHLHFEVLKNGKNVNPLSYLPQLGN